MTKTTKQPKKETKTPAFTVPKNTDEALALVVNEKAFKTKYLNPIGVTGKKLRDLVHNAAMQALLLVYGSNQTRYDYFNDLMDTVRDNLSKTQGDQLIAWVERYSPSRYTKTKNGYSFRKDKNENANEFQLEEAFNNPFWMIDIKKETIEKMMSSANLIASLESRIKKIEDNLLNDKVEADDRDEVIAIVESLKAVTKAHKPVASNDDSVEEKQVA